jgi:hypothetical protein
MGTHMPQTSGTDPFQLGTWHPCLQGERKVNERKDERHMEVSIL